MFFYLSKIAFFVVRPSNLLWISTVVGVILILVGRKRLGLGLIGASLALQALFFTTPVPSLLLYPLEQRFQVPDLSKISPDGIIVLGGALETSIFNHHQGSAINEAGERMIVGAELARRFPEAKLVFTGGTGALFRGPSREADAASVVWNALGVSKTQLVYENQSRNTWENATLTRQLLKPAPDQTWLLVTSAYHMPRSMGVFEAAGWTNVVAYPVDFRTDGTADRYPAVVFGSLSAGARRVDTAVREWIGLVAYWASGRSSSLLPGE